MFSLWDFRHFCHSLTVWPQVWVNSSLNSPSSSPLVNLFASKCLIPCAHLERQNPNGIVCPLCQHALGQLTGLLLFCWCWVPGVPLVGGQWYCLSFGLEYFFVLYSFLSHFSFPLSFSLSALTTLIILGRQGICNALVLVYYIDRLCLQPWKSAVACRLPWKVKGIKQLTLDHERVQSCASLH